MVGVDSRERIDIVNLTVSVFFLPCWYLSLHTESKLSVKNIEIELRILANCWDCFQYVSRLSQSKHDKCLDWALVEKRYQFSRKNQFFGPGMLMLYLFEQGQLWSQPCEMLSPPTLLYLIFYLSISALDYTTVTNNVEIAVFLAEIFFALGQDILGKDPSGNTIVRVFI